MIYYKLSYSIACSEPDLSEPLQQNVKLHRLKAAESGIAWEGRTELYSSAALVNMGSYATLPDWSGETDGDDESEDKLGDLLSGRLADVDIDSVAAVRETRERR